MLIHVTRSHIDRGCRGDGQACPVALALEEVTGYRWLVENDWLTCFAPAGRFRLRTPPEVSLFINEFDDGDEVEPFEFELDVEGVG